MTERDGQEQPQGVSSGEDRATQAPPQAPAGLGHAVSVPDAEVFAIPPSGAADYLTPGKPYRVFNDDDGLFAVIDDDREEIVCLWQNCAHLDGGDWQRANAAAIEACRVETGTGSIHESADPQGAAQTPHRRIPMTDTMRVELEPCPFCGGAPHPPCEERGHKNDGWWSIACSQCDVKLSGLWDKEAAITAWSTRTHSYATGFREGVGAAAKVVREKFEQAAWTADILEAIRALTPSEAQPCQDELVGALRECRRELGYCAKQLAIHGVEGTKGDCVDRALEAADKALARIGGGA
jgi:hypothetical protein